MLPASTARVFISDKNVSRGKTIHGEPTKAILQTGENIVYKSSKTLDQRGRTSVLFRVVGENSSGWAEVAALWGGTTEIITRRHKINHHNCGRFKIPRSISHANAFSMGPVDPPWDGIFLATVWGAEYAADVRALFKNWQPLIAILALPTSLSRKGLNKLISVMPFSETHTRLDVFATHTSFGGVTQAAWNFVH